MNATTNSLRSTLADARTRAQRERRDVVCVVSAEAMAHVPRRAQSADRPHAIRVIVRPDEPAVFCGLFPM